MSAVHVALASEAVTERVAAMVAGILEPGDIVTLAGEVGAGKTTFVRAAARALGVTEPVRSPTYTIAHVYRGRGDTTVAHLDLYRSGELDAASFADIEPTFDAVASFVEWAAPLSHWMDDRATWHLALRDAGPDARVLEIFAPDEPRRRALLAAIGHLAS